MSSTRTYSCLTVFAMLTISIACVVVAIGGMRTTIETGVLVSEDHRVLCTELGLTPEALAAMGVQGHQVNGIFGTIDESDGLIGSLRSLQSQHQTLLASLKNARSIIRHAENSDEEAQIQAQIDQLTADITTHTQGIDQAMHQIRQAILPGGIGAQTISRVCAPSGLTAQIPVEYRFVDLRPEDHAELIAALNAERRAHANDQQPDTDTQLLLSGYRNLPAVLQARSNLLYNLDAVRAAFND